MEEDVSMISEKTSHCDKRAKWSQDMSGDGGLTLSGIVWDFLRIMSNFPSPGKFFSVVSLKTLLRIAEEKVIILIAVCVFLSKKKGVKSGEN